jgi:hypothetical protein
MERGFQPLNCVKSLCIYVANIMDLYGIMYGIPSTDTNGIRAWIHAYAFANQAWKPLNRHSLCSRFGNYVSSVALSHPGSLWVLDRARIPFVSTDGMYVIP